MTIALEQMVDCYSTRTIGTAYQTLDSGLTGFGPRCEMGGLHDCGIDGWNTTDRGARPIGEVSGADFDPYGGRSTSLPGPYGNANGAFNDGAILGGSRDTWYETNILHPNENDELLKSIYKPNRDFTLDIYNRGEVSVHQFGEYNPASKRISNIHIDIGLDHGTKLDVDRLTGDNNQIKDLWPLFER